MCTKGLFIKEIERKTVLGEERPFFVRQKRRDLFVICLFFLHYSNEKSTNTFSPFKNREPLWGAAGSHKNYQYRVVAELTEAWAGTFNKGVSPLFSY
jgi:hypothetical protein